MCGVTLEERVRKPLIMRLELSCFWIDSTIVLSWITNDAKKLETFVVNRVRRIRESVDPGQFKHVYGMGNPADLVSRGGTVSEVEMWHQGPVFLLDPGLDTVFEKRNLHINNANVPQVQSTKFLGIIIDEQINWKPQILAVRCKLSKTVSIMYKASKLINPEGMLTLYHSLFMPYLCYCNEVWSNTYASNVKCIFYSTEKGYPITLR